MIYLYSKRHYVRDEYIIENVSEFFEDNILPCIGKENDWDEEDIALIHRHSGCLAVEGTTLVTKYGPMALKNCGNALKACLTAHYLIRNKIDAVINLTNLLTANLEDFFRYCYNFNLQVLLTKSRLDIKARNYPCILNDSDQMLLMEALEKIRNTLCGTAKDYYKRIQFNYGSTKFDFSIEETVVNLNFDDSIIKNQFLEGVLDNTIIESDWADNILFARDFHEMEPKIKAASSPYIVIIDTENYEDATADYYDCPNVIAVYVRSKHEVDVEPYANRIHIIETVVYKDNEKLHEYTMEYLDTMKPFSDIEIM